ncbi:hemolysin-type calcium-binding repeat 2 copies family protein [Asticcacaulis biprosthecium C19]|uniref:Hemolysin-type calcium-binding repeat 2 copies family protein n=2 Tax=Asticcacaulis biprosthecium TaxID=76891 RepID=F4QKA5_9CAUL|nr:hemolysin-type calcium-binding repeat 2 copies family protein [Asticcacaulis biprosthecium C19]
MSLAGATAGVTADLTAAFSGGVSTIGGALLTGLEQYSVIYGSSDSDAITVGNASENNGPDANGLGVYAGDGNDTLTGGSATNRLHGEGGNDSLSGLSGGDELYGGEDGDVLEGGLGNDTIDGGAGNDTASYASATAAVTVSLAITVAQNTGGAGSDTLLEIENLTGSGYADSLTGSDSDNVLDGGIGNDTLTGGLGDDTYYVQATGDKVVELNGEGTDIIYSSASYSLSGRYVEVLTLTGTANTNATGNSLGNTLNGNTGSNSLDGAAGNDTMAGGLGDDTYYVQTTGDNVVEAGGQGTDVIFSTVSYSLSGRFAEVINLTGSANINATGNSTNNTLTGNDGTNTLNGKGGADYLAGGLGADVFLFEASSGKDTITDFSAAQNDSLNVNAYTGGVANAGLVAQVGGNVVITFSSANTITVLNASQADVLAHMVW